jgi:hypothetical protein
MLAPNAEHARCFRAVASASIECASDQHLLKTSERVRKILIGPIDGLR